MKKSILLLGFFIINYSFLSVKSLAQNAHPDTVYTGIHVTSIHNIDFRKNEYSLTFWLWLKYKNKQFDFVKYLEIPQAKDFKLLYSSVDSSNNRIYIVMKLECLMKDSWKVGDFPFDRQKLWLTIENSQYPSDSLVFAEDKIDKNYYAKDITGKHYYQERSLNGSRGIVGWQIDSFNVSIGKNLYETAFGDTTYDKPLSEYSDFRVKISIQHKSQGLFWKMFIGMYLTFLIAYICFYIHADSIDSRFGLSVGALFAVMANKYIIDSSLPESTSLTLVDTLHWLTLAFIFAVITATAYSLKLVKAKKIKKANRFDMITAQVLLLIYVILNIYYISQASKGG